MHAVPEAFYPHEICVACGFSHARSRRLEALRRMLPLDTEEIRAAHPCWWGTEARDRGERTLYRDLHALGAVQVLPGMWGLPTAKRAA